MPAVINVGGPVAWGLVILVSAWAVRAGRALAGRRRDQSNQEDGELEIDPSAPQPRFLQQLSATAIRMLIETGALPCAVLELSDGGGGSSGDGSGAQSGRQKRPAAPPKAKGQGAGAAANPTPGFVAAAGGPVLYGPSRIVPPELAAAVPCMPAAAWVRALQSPEQWRAELTRSAAAAAAATPGDSLPSGSGAAALRASCSAPYAAAPYGRTSEGLLTPPRQVHSLNSSGGGGFGVGLGQQGYSLSSPFPLACGAPQARQAEGAAASQPHTDAAAETAADRASAGSSGLGPGRGAGLALLRQESAQLTAPTDAAASTAAAGPFGAVSGVRGSFGGAAAVAAAAASNMAALPYPPRHAMLVVLGRSERAVAAVTAAAASAGYTRSGTWVGAPGAFAATSLAGRRLPALSRNGLWLMLQLGPDPLFHVPSLVLDVRRPDERLSYGAIRGTVNVPAEELATALALPPPDFRRRYGAARPGPDDVVVTCSRSGRRAAWAAQLCVDAGLKRVFVYGEGVYGWRLEDRVKPYRAYDLGALPPDPEPFNPEEPDEAAGLEELHALGMPLRQGPRPSRFALVAPAHAAAPAHATAAHVPAPLPLGVGPGGVAGGGPMLPLPTTVATAAAAGPTGQPYAAGYGTGAAGVWQRGL